MEPSTKTLAEGCFGKVYKEKYNDKWAAMKKVPVKLITKKEISKMFRLYDKAKHNNVVKILGQPWEKDKMWQIPLEFVLGEDLETAIFNVEKSKVKLTSSVKATIIKGMCEGLNFLHSKDIVHQDLKPDKIMIEHESNRAVIIDMGLAKFLKNGLSSAGNGGNEAYSAPEIFKRKVRDKCSDVWAMGKIIGELCKMARLLTHSVTPTEVKESLKDNPYCSVVSRMVMTPAEKRASMAEVIGEIRKIEEGVGRQNAGLMDACGPGTADLGFQRESGLHNPFPTEAKHHETPSMHIHQSPFPREEATMAEVIGEMPQMKAEPGRLNAGLMDACGPGTADLGFRRESGLHNPFPTETTHHETPSMHIHQSPFPREEATMAEVIGEMQRMKAGPGRLNAGLMDDWGLEAADLGFRREWGLHNPFPKEATHHETPAMRIHQSLFQREKATMAEMFGKTLQMETGAGRLNAGLMDDWGLGAADLEFGREWDLHNPFPTEETHFETPAMRIHQSLFPQRSPFASENMFSPMVDHHEVHEFKQIVMKDGKVVKYEDVKFTK